MLKRQLTVWDVFSLAAGAMISSGLFVLPGIAFAKTGPSMIIAYLFAGILYLPAMFAQAELVTALPKSGGSYFFVERSLGGMMGTLIGLANWFSLALKGAFAFLGLGTLILLLKPDAPLAVVKALAITCCFLFAALNLFSVKGTGTLQRYMVIPLLFILTMYALAGFAFVQPVRYQPFFQGGPLSLFTVTGMVFISYGGLTKVVDVAGEVKNPQRDLLHGMIAAFVVVNTLYLAAVFVTVGVIPGETLAHSLTPLTESAGTFMGSWGASLVAAAAFFAYATTGNASILSSSRSPMAMGHDNLLPPFFAKTSRRYHTPHFAILITVAGMAAVLAGFTIENLVKAASAMLLLSFVMANVAAIVLRHSGIEGYRPTFRIPLYPYLPIAGILIYSILIITMGLLPLLMSLGLLTMSGFWYLVYGRTRVTREPAVRQMVRRILARHVARTGIEEEFLQITLERDDVALDYFDRLVQDAPVFNLQESTTKEQLFTQIAELLSPELEQTQDELYQLLIRREEEDSTVIEPGLAVPHIPVKGEGIFKIVIVRCLSGIVFEEDLEPVRTAFVLVASPDRRQLHLQALMAIAATVQAPDFSKRWNNARTPAQLRDVILLSGRRRIPH